MASQLIPAVVLGIDTPIGLAIVRDLGKRGVAIHGLGWDADAIGLSSRYLRRGIIRAQGESQLIEQLLELRGELGPACLFAISESDIAMLNRHRALLTGFKLMFADAARMDRVLNKERTYALAAGLGISVPATVQLHSLAQAESACAQLRFPVVLKWANPHAVSERLSADGLALEKSHYCYSGEELLAYLRSYEPAGVFPLIQEYCPGHGLGQFILMKGGRARYLFQHRRLHEWPPEGGCSSLCESVSPDAHAGLMAQSVALLRALEWEGVAMVEYRHDPDSGASALMEVNGRFWGSLPLALHAGANFPWLAYQAFGLDRNVGQAPYRAGLRCRFMIPETRRLLCILFQQARIPAAGPGFGRLPALLTYLSDFLRPCTRYYVFKLSDPAPFFRDIVRAAWRVVRMRWIAATTADPVKGFDS